MRLQVLLGPLLWLGLVPWEHAKDTIPSWSDEVYSMFLLFRHGVQFDRSLQLGHCNFDCISRAAKSWRSKPGLSNSILQQLDVDHMDRIPPCCNQKDHLGCYSCRIWILQQLWIIQGHCNYPTNQIWGRMIENTFNKSNSYHILLMPN